MARHFGKKRRPKPNKNQQKVMRAVRQERDADSVGTLAERYPMFSSLELEITFVSRHNQLLDQRRLSLKPEDRCDLFAECPGRCGSFVFDFNEAVSQMSAAQKTSMEFQAVCQERPMGYIPELCGCQMTCKITAAY